MPNGEGTSYTHSGEKYVGQWENDKTTDRGIYY